MSITITLTPALIVGIVYALGVLATAAFFAGIEQSHRTTKYLRIIAIAFVWPIAFLQIAVLAPLGLYIGDMYESVKTKIDQLFCNHENITSHPEKENPDWNNESISRKCEDCGKVKFKKRE